METRLIPTVTRDPDLLRAAQALRHRVFVEEGGAAGGPDGLEADPFDAAADHLVLRDPMRAWPGIVATTRLARGTAYTETEFDMGPLRRSGRPLAEMGRTCLHPDHRGGLAAFALLRAALDHMAGQGAEVVVGTASLPGADPAAHLPALRRLMAEALAPAPFRPVARGPNAIRVTGAAPRSAMRRVPAHLKSYLRAGAWVGQDAWLDRAFNTVDVCVVLDLARLRLPRLPAARIPADA
ncbi:MAG: GNAT family N-acyltransferase [Pseudomonadota bacterium]